jgi:protein SCO1/2
MQIPMRRKWLFYVAFFTLLIVGFYFTLARVIPGYADKKFKVLNYVQPFAFTNQDGQQVTQEDVLGKVYVAEYFFTTCPSICPIMNSNMKKVYEAYKDEPDFLILSHTCDPDNDNVGRLKQYADSLQVNTQKWVFLTGKKDSLYNTARVSYLLDDPKNNYQNIDDQFLHTQFFALVDKNGNVRKKIYDGLKKQEIEELKKDIAVLLKEPTQKRFVNNLFQ